MKSKEIYELGMGDNVYEDDNLYWSDELTAKHPEAGPTRPIEVVIPKVEITGIKPALFNDKDSASTFWSKHKDTANNSVQISKQSNAKSHLCSFHRTVRLRPQALCRFLLM